MKISKKELIEMEACSGGLKRFIQQTNNTDEPVCVASLVGGKNNYSDLLWLAGEKLDKSRIVRFACDCALLNIELIKPYTDKYDLIVEFLKNPAAATAATSARAAYVYATTAAVAAAAADTAAARAAYAASAARAAYAAAASAAASAAAAAAAHAAAYAAYVDYASAAYASAYAASAANSEKVNQLLINMFNEVN